MLQIDSGSLSDEKDASIPTSPVSMREGKERELSQTQLVHRPLILEDQANSPSWACCLAGWVSAPT